MTPGPGGPGGPGGAEDGDGLEDEDDVEDIAIHSIVIAQTNICSSWAQISFFFCYFCFFLY